MKSKRKAIVNEHNGIQEVPRMKTVEEIENEDPKKV